MTVGQAAFAGCSALRTVSLPARLLVPDRETAVDTVFGADHPPFELTLLP